LGKETPQKEGETNSEAMTIKLRETTMVSTETPMRRQE